MIARYRVLQKRILEELHELEGTVDAIQRHWDECRIWLSTCQRYGRRCVRR